MSCRLKGDRRKAGSSQTCQDPLPDPGSLDIPAAGQSLLERLVFLRAPVIAT